MIYVSMGTSSPFPRLLKRMDELAAETGLEIVVQTGHTPQTAQHCRMIQFVPSQKEYFQQASLIISHAGLGTQLELLRMHRPFVVVPRRAEYQEHNDNHQVETCEILHKKYGILYFLETKDITASVLRNPPSPYSFSDENLEIFRKNILPVILGEN